LTARNGMPCEFAYLTCVGNRLTKSIFTAKEVKAYYDGNIGLLSRLNHNKEIRLGIRLPALRCIEPSRIVVTKDRRIGRQFWTQLSADSCRCQTERSTGPLLSQKKSEEPLQLWAQLPMPATRRNGASRAMKDVRICQVKLSL
jgi:hypothetical protein